MLGEFLLAGGNVPFVAALVLMLLVGLAEAVGLGGGLSADGDVDLDADADSPSLLNWLNVGRLPFLMLLVVFLFAFGMIGLVGQRLCMAITGHLAPAIVAALLALILAVPLTRFFARIVSRIMPQDETTAVRRDTLVGRIAVIVTGTSIAGNAAQARVRDAHGQAHYVMVEPDEPDVAFQEGSSVILVRQAGASYLAVADDSAPTRSLGT